MDRIKIPKNIIKKSILTIISGIFLVALVFSSIKHFRVNFEKKNLSLNNFSLSRFQAENNIIKSIAPDAQMEYYSPWTYLSTIKIELTQPIKQDSIITLYYNTGNGYSEKDMLSFSAKAGTSDIPQFDINKKVVSCRIDLGEEAGQEFAISKISVNSGNEINKQKLMYIFKYVVKLLVVILIYTIFLFILVKINFEKLFIYFKGKLTKNIKLIFTKKSLLIVTGGIIVIFFGFLIEFIVGYSSINHFNDKKDFIIKNEDAISSDIKFDNKDIVTTNSNSKITFKLSDKYVKDLALRIKSGRGAKIHVFINEHEVGKTNVCNSDPYGLVALNDSIPVVYSLNQKVNNIQIVCENKDVIISEVLAINHYSYNFARGAFYSAILFLLYGIIIIIVRKNAKVEILFFMISLTIGSAFALTLPINNSLSWDAQIHYVKSSQLLNFSDEFLSKNEENLFNFRLPTTYSLTEREFIQTEFKNNDMSKVGAGINRNAYRLIGYLPSALVLSVGKLLKISYDIVFILGRWINVFVFCIVMYFAIKKLKTGKIILSLIALMPTSIFVSSNYNYDSWLTAFSMLGFAYFISELQQPDKIISTKEWIIMIGAFVLGLGPKAIYFPIMFMLFFIRPKKFKSKNNYKFYKCALIISILFVIASFVLPLFINGAGDGDPRGGSSVNSSEQLKFILTTPFEYAKILLNFMSNYLKIENIIPYTQSLAYMGELNYLLLVILLIIATFTDKNEYDVHSSTLMIRSSMIFALFAIIALICTALYIDFTPVRYKSISGVQGRYLIPLLFPFFSIVGSCKIKNNINKNVYNLTMLIIPAAILLKIMWDLCIRFYY